MKPLTATQSEVLEALAPGPATIRGLCARGRHPRSFSYDSLHSRLRSLASNGLVARVDNTRPAIWQLTVAGRQALEADRGRA